MWLVTKINSWLKGKIQAWLKEEVLPEPLLKCLENGRVTTYRIVGSVGLYLIADGRGVVGPGIACDPAHYDALWEHFNKDVSVEWVEPEDARDDV